MNITEEEAKTKWCPYSGERSPNPSDPYSLCMGSKCMAWRKAGEKCKNQRTGELTDLNKDGLGTWVGIGYCGLAGKS